MHRCLGISSCLFRKHPYFHGVPLPFIRLRIRPVVLGCVFTNCLENWKEDSTRMAPGLLEVWPSVVWKTFWVLNSNTYNYRGVILSIKKKTKQRKQSPLLTRCSHSMCSPFPKPVWPLFLAWWGISPIFL